MRDIEYDIRIARAVLVRKVLDGTATEAERAEVESLRNWLDGHRHGIAEGRRLEAAEIADLIAKKVREPLLGRSDGDRLRDLEGWCDELCGHLRERGKKAGM